MQQLLIGSAKLNLMQDDITKTVKILTSAVYEGFPGLTVCSRDGKVIWTVMWGSGGKLSQTFSVGPGIYRDNEIYTLQSRDVAKAHSEFPVLAEQFFASVSHALTHFAPVLAAAEQKL